jgi:ribosomal protein S18 acetylase RimI-like enzyme
MHAPERLPPFPTAAALPDISQAMRARGVGVRGATADAIDYLRALFHAQKSEELALASWPQTLKQTLLDQQFAVQHMQYVSAYPAADFWVIEHRQQPIGRYYLLRESPCYHVVDITLEMDWRGRGVGSLLLEWTQSLVHQHRANGIGLHVDERNTGARRLYERYGFIETSREAPRIAMRWTKAT